MIPLAYPYIPEEAKQAVLRTLNTRWIGQGPRVDELEQKFQEKFGTLPAVATGAGTDALHLAYLLTGIAEGDEVISPVFTCTATNIPLLWLKAKIVFADVQSTTLNIDPVDVARKITAKTKAIVTVDYAGQPCDYDALIALARKHNLTLIDDAAHAVGATFDGHHIGSIADHTCFSFQAIKHITSGDGGLLCTNESRRAKLLRWFGLDREKKLENISVWEGDIEEIGYKYQMTDIGASMALASLAKIDEQLDHRRELVKIYRAGLQGIPGIELLEERSGRISANWLMTILADNQEALIGHLNDHEIESSPLHYRNDRYSIFSDSRGSFPGMDSVEERILCLPLNMSLARRHVMDVVDAIRSFYGAKPLAKPESAAAVLKVS
jgi:perosamine synthetase